MDNKSLLSHGVKRLRKDRRIFTYAAYTPEKRSGKDRRSGFDKHRKQK